MMCSKIFSDFLYEYGSLINHLGVYHICITKVALTKAEFTIFDMIRHDYSLHPEELAEIMAKIKIN
jgi:hypothetical protein